MLIQHRDPFFPRLDTAADILAALVCAALFAALVFALRYAIGS